MGVETDRLAFASIRELGRMLRAGETTPTGLAEFFLDRLDTVGRGLNAVVTLTRERALDEARVAERELAAGHDRGPLHGIPYGAKDLCATAPPYPTSWGAAPLRDQQFAHDATAIARLRGAGAVLVAKLAMVETLRDVAVDNADFARVVLPLLEEFLASRGQSEHAAALVAVTRVRHAHRGSETR